MSDKGWWESLGGGAVVAGLLGCIPAILRNKSAKSVEDAKGNTAHEEGTAADKKTAEQIARQSAALAELVQQCLARLGKLEDRLDEKDVEIKELQEQVRLKAERIAALEKVPICLQEGCPKLQARDAEISRLTQEIGELQVKITALEVLGERHAI